MTEHSFQLSPNCVAEVVGDDVLVFLSGEPGAIRLSGAAARTFLSIQAGEQVDLSNSAVKELEAVGILRSPGVSRRGLLKGGAIGTAAGVAVLALPSVAAASSAEQGATESSAEELVGSLFAFGWDSNFNQNRADFAYIKDTLGLADDGLVGIVTVNDQKTPPPYAVEDLDKDNPIEGSVVVDGVTYDAWLFVWNDGVGATPTDAPTWFFAGLTTAPPFGTDFVVTFSYEGVSYTVVKEDFVPL
jgi:hypothetical protein